MKVIITGAGIGGLSLALMLHARGIECEIYESVPELKPLGVGINLLPHAANEMDQLGLLETLSSNAVATSALHYYNCHGQKIWQEPRGLAAGYPVPQLSIHRGKLQMLLAQAVIERLGADRLHTGMTFESVQENEDGVTACFVNRDANTRHTVKADVLIGADGIHSAVRKQFYPANDDFQFSGRILWRAVTYTTAFLDGKTMFMAGHPDVKFVAYPILDDQTPAGKTAINWIAELTVPDYDLSKTDWNRGVDKSVFEGPFQSWKWDWIDIPALIAGTHAVYEFPLVDKNPLPRWSFGHTTLMGDAAHPLYPIGSNGSAQAILDARCLADHLQKVVSGRHRSVPAALKEYEADRIPPTTGLILRNRLNGPEQVMQMAHERAPEGFTHIHDVVSPDELEEVSMRYKRIAGFDPKALKRA
ncbi:flavin-dependent oxidoreductase [Pusillimonas minor]|uniref:Flavin-dependent oxidoreductase n=1 Tax=Pusillimonas minor TaxID=2697024 RepID=A0A842HMW8_9BURK|nr:flavin-dependent oxidoreductase [Pusillimonas minor]MBC2769586.1 flavin-dependent oxidoreductase [Pusillimonas minor]